MSADDKADSKMPAVQAAAQASAPAEHPDGDAIRRQVEYYFSDENLPNDRHLLEFCRGRENVPVSLNRICGFKKMRQYKPRRSVIEALRHSAFLNVSKDGKTICRKVPLVGPTVLDDIVDESDDGIAYAPNAEPKEPQDANDKQKQGTKVLQPSVKAREIPVGMTKNMMKPHGFEVNYVEGPITPAQAEEDAQLYDPETPFSQRIELGIQRFKQKRKMHEIYSRVFNKWMHFGGVDASPRQFAGKPQAAELEGLDAADRTHVMATHQVPANREDPGKWAVDFEGVARGFFSSYYPICFRLNDHDVKTACQVLRSFYNFILLHSVCPEYEHDILAARRVCDLAENELMVTQRAGFVLPGTFGVAASTLYDGYFAGLYVGDDAEWDASTHDAWSGDDDEAQGGMKREEAVVVFKTGVVVHGTDEQYNALERGGGVDALHVVRRETVGLAVVAIQPAAPDVRDVYASQNEQWKHKLRLKPLGKLLCTCWDAPTCLEYDVPPPPPALRDYEFWVDDDVLAVCFVGMKFDARVLHLTTGLVVLDSVVNTYCSFYQWLPNELLIESRDKEIRFLKPKDAELADLKEEEDQGNDDETALVLQSGKAQAKAPAQCDLPDLEVANGQTASCSIITPESAVNQDQD